jgi:hypothetical protein
MIVPFPVVVYTMGLIGAPVTGTARQKPCAQKDNPVSDARARSADVIRTAVRRCGKKVFRLSLKLCETHLRYTRAVLWGTAVDMRLVEDRPAVGSLLVEDIQQVEHTLGQMGMAAAGGIPVVHRIVVDKPC